MTDANRLLYGKSEVSGVVSIEVENEEIILFCQDKAGDVLIERRPNKYWILSHYPLDNDFFRLKGELFYKWGKQFTDRDDYGRHRGMWRNQDIFSIYNPQEAAMVKDGYTYFKDLKHTDLSILAFDIETTGLEHNDKSKLLLIANTFRNSKGNITRKLFAYNDYFDEGKMIDAWCTWVRQVSPSIMCGHNVMSFDIPYMNFIAQKFGTTLRLGKNDSSIKFDTFESKFRKDGSQFYPYKKCRIYGREIIDTMFLAIKYDIASRKYDSYGLKNIIKQEGLEKEGRIFYDAAKIKDNYTNPTEWAKIKTYAESDGDDALALYDLMAAPFFYMTRNVPKTFQSIIEGASGSQLNAIMMRAYLQEGHSLPKASEPIDFEGAISFGKAGLYHNVMKVDVSSLYPSIMLEYKICDEYKDPNKHLLTLLETFRNERLKNKQLAKDTGDNFYKHLEQSQKTFINSLYGFLGAPGLLFNYPKGAAEVTRYGREILVKAVDWARNRDLTVCNADTDSISFCLEKMNEIHKDVQNLYLNDLNKLYPENIKWEHDGMYKHFLIVGAKNYVLEGMDGKRKLKGSALTAKTKEPRLLDFIYDFIDLLLYEHNGKIPEMYDHYVKEIMNIKSIKGWCTKKTITDKVMNPERTNEQKVSDALAGEEGLQQGDKRYFFFKSDNSLCLQEKFSGDYSKERLLEKLYKSAVIFDEVYDVKTNLLNYKLKRNQKVLNGL